MSEHTLQHTPGPWIVEGDNICWVGRQTGSHYVLASLPTNPSKEVQNNACLIAAAPEMLDALRNVRDWAKASGLIQHDSMLGEDIEAAIVKAEGTENPAPRRP